MRIKLRRVRIKDARDFTACHISCWQAAYRGIIPDSYLDNMNTELDARTERCVQSLSNPGTNEFFYVGHKGQMIGRLIICKSRDADMPHAGEIGAFYLVRAFWGKGYGKAMMGFALKRLKRKGHRDVLLWVLEENARARRFYEKCGFVFDGTKKEIEVGKPLIEVRYVLLY